MSSSRFKLLPLALGVACLYESMAMAQEAPPPPPAPAPEEATPAFAGIEEVIVTARKTEESVQDVPVSITALSADAMTKDAVLSVSDLRSSVPGLFISPNSQGGAPTFAIRAAKADNGTSDTVTAYVGDVPVASTRSIANMMYDMQSVSVLKGPQGTLFGANSTGGAIIFQPNLPTGFFEGYLDVGYGNYDRKTVEGMVNIPFNDSVQLRLSGQWVDRSEGYITNTTTEPTPGIYGSGYNGVRELRTDKHESGRAILRIQPNDVFQNDLEFDYFHQDDQGAQTDVLTALRDPYPYNTEGLAAAIPGFPTSLDVDYGEFGIEMQDGRNVELNADPVWNKADIFNVFNTTNLYLTDDATAKLVLGYQDLDLDTAQQNSLTPAVVVSGRTHYMTKRYTVEPSLDLTFMEGRVRNKTGLFYMRTDQDSPLAYRVVGLPFSQTTANNNTLVTVGVDESGNLIQYPAWAVTAGIFPFITNHLYNRTFDSYAIYNQVSFDVTDATTLTFGARYTWDEGDYQESAFSAGPSTPGAADSYGDPTFGSCATSNLTYYPEYDLDACTANASYSSSAPSFTLTLENQLTDRTMVYTTARVGYLVGGFNNDAKPGVSGVDITFNPEKVTDFEAGVKSDWELFGRPIRTNLAGFYGNYKDQQRVQNGIIDGQTFVGVVNAGASTFYGFDFDGTYALTDHLTLSASWTHVESEYTRFDAIVNVPGKYAYVDLSGEPMSQTPKDQVTARLSALWPIPSNLGTIESTLSYSYVASTTSKDSPVYDCNPNPAGECFGPSSPDLDFRAYDELPSYGIFNFTTGWSGIMNSGFDVNLWVKNVTDKTYAVATNNQLLQFGYSVATYGDPRTYGVNLRYNF